MHIITHKTASLFSRFMTIYQAHFNLGAELNRCTGFTPDYGPHMMLGDTHDPRFHRFTNAVQANFIHVMNQGIIVESGTHEEQTKKTACMPDHGKNKLKNTTTPPKFFLGNT